MSQTTGNGKRPIRILLLNPNSSKDMTSGMETAAKSVPSNSVEIHSYTASSGPDSINNAEDIAESDKAVLADFHNSDDLKSNNYDAILVACYSVHSLVTALTQWTPTVTGIFEASLLTALSLINPKGEEQWGIVTTGKFWEKHLTDGVNEFLGHLPEGDGSSNKKFAGVYSTGLNAGDFHRVSPEEVRAKLKEATTQLLKSGNVTCVVMGCGGMAGLEDIIRSTASEVYGKDRADALYIVDGVKAGILQLEQTIRSKDIFR